MPNPTNFVSPPFIDDAEPTKVIGAGVDGTITYRTVSRKHVSLERRTYLVNHMSNTILEDLIRGDDLRVVDIIVVTPNCYGHVCPSLCHICGPVFKCRQVPNEVGYDVSREQTCRRSIVARSIGSREGGVGREEASYCRCIVER